MRAKFSIRLLEHHFFVLPHVFMFFGLFVAFRSGMYISIIGIIFLIANRHILFHTIRYNLLFGLLILLELISTFYYFTLSDVREFVISNPKIIFTSISYLLIPQLTYFFIGYLNGKNFDRIQRLLYTILLLNFFSIILGILLFIIRPNFYLNFLERNLFESYKYYSSFYPRLVGYYGTAMIVGIISSTSFILTLGVVKKKKIRIIFLVTFLIGTFMSLQRGAWFSLILGILFYYFLRLRNRTLKIPNLKINGKIILVFSSILLIISLITLKIKDASSIDYFVHELIVRLGRIGNAVAERSDQWQNAINIIKQNYLGTGIGILSHKGASIGYTDAVPDGNYFRILGEIGILGFLIFVGLVLQVLSNLIKYHIFLATVFFMYLVQAIGTNVFDLFYSGFIFWFIVGIGVALKRNEI